MTRACYCTNDVQRGIISLSDDADRSYKRIAPSWVVVGCTSNVSLPCTQAPSHCRSRTLST